MKNNKPVIGIMPQSTYLRTDNPSDDHYSYTDTYIKTLVKYGAIPYFIPLVSNEIIEGTLDDLDGLFIPGGLSIKPFFFDIIDYFYKKKLPILGVCLGMQALSMYSVRIYDKEKRVIKDVDNGVNHRPQEITRDNHSFLVHDIYINNDSILYRLFNTEKLKVNSLHKHTITEVGPDFKITAKSFDGLIEAIEYSGTDRYVHGVQFHPELVPELEIVYKDFISKARK